MIKVIQKADAVLGKLLPPGKWRPDVYYKPSLYTLPFRHNGKSYLYNTMTHQCLEAGLPSAGLISEEYGPLVEGFFLVPDGKDETAFYMSTRTVLDAFTRKKGMNGFTILPTLGCNARCTYCYEEGMTKLSMTPETIEQTIRFILKNHSGNKAKLDWFGGEPLLNPKAIDRICEGLREAGLAYSSSMVTNGSLLEDEIIEKMASLWNLTSVQISMDGDESDYICRKRYYSYHDYYHKIMESVNKLSDRGISSNIRCNVDEDNWERVPAFIQDIKAGIRNKEKVSIHFAPLDSVRMGKNDIDLWKKIPAAQHMVKDAGFRSRYLITPEAHFRTTHCMADSGGVVIAPDGSLYLCEQCQKEARFGDIWHGVTDEDARKSFSRTSVIREKCRSCPFLPQCTPFDHCPVVDTHCREMWYIMTMEYLKNLIDHEKHIPCNIP